MGNAVLAGRPFRLDPTSVSWDFVVGVSETTTLGGRVVQVFGAKLGDLVVEGSFGRGGWEEQATFLEQVKQLGQGQLDRWPQPNIAPYRFVWPTYGWDFQVWIKDYVEPGSTSSVDMRVDNVAPTWQLTLVIVEDNAVLKTISSDAYISRLAAGMGWHPSEFNGPQTVEALQKILGEAGVSTVRQYVSMRYGLANPLQDGSAAALASSAGTAGPHAQQTIASMVGLVKSVGFSGMAAATAIAVAMAESGGNPNSHNATPPDDSYGLWQINMLGSLGPARRKQFGLTSNDQLYDPVVNARAAFSISSGGNNWTPWSTFNNGAYKTFINDARAAVGV